LIMHAPSKSTFEVRRLLEAARQRALVAVTPAAALVRWSALLATLCALWVTLFGFGAGNNVAFGKPVKMSNRCDERGEHSWAPVHPSRLVDGKTWRPYDVCTAKMIEPWALINLKQNTRIDTVIVTGRRDCCSGYQDLPVVLELSPDGSTFERKAQRDLPLSDRDPWRVELNGAVGKFVRVRVVSKDPAELMLNEVEVFGTPMPEGSAR